MDRTDVEAVEMISYGILGFDVLSRFDVSLDFRTWTMVLYPPADDVANCDVCGVDVSTSFELAEGTHIQFEVSIGAWGTGHALERPTPGSCRPHDHERVPTGR